MIKSFYPPCLSNNKNLSLGNISLRYRHVEGVPSLLTVYELKRPLLQAYNEIKLIITDLEYKENSNYAIKGLFTLGIAYFETMFSDLLTNYLKFFPEKIISMRSQAGISRNEKKEFYITQEMINNGNITQNIIELEISKLMYSNIQDITLSFYNLLSLEPTNLLASIDLLNEIKQTRNLLLHNNLRVNSYYLNNTKNYSRASKHADSIPINNNYALSSMKLLLNLTLDILQGIDQKYGKYTLVNLLSRLWGYTFKNQDIKIEDFCVLNLNKDSIDGPFNSCDYLGFLSSSECFFWELWRSQRAGNPLNFHLTLLDEANVTKTAILVEIFGEFRFPLWIP